MLTIHSLIYSQLKFIANKDLRRRKSIAGLLCWKPLNYTKLHSLHEWSAFSVRYLLNYKNLHSLCQWSVSSVWYLLNYMNLHSLCEWSVSSVCFTCHLPDVYLTFNRKGNIMSEQNWSHRKEMSDSLLLSRAGYSEHNGRLTASARGPEMWRFVSYTDLFVNSGPIR